MTEDFRVRFLIVDDQQSIRKLCMTIGASSQTWSSGDVRTSRGR